MIGRIMGKYTVHKQLIGLIKYAELQQFRHSRRVPLAVQISTQTINTGLCNIRPTAQEGVQLKTHNIKLAVVK